MVERVVEGAIAAAGQGDNENLLTDLYERLDDFERYENFTDQPIGAVAARIAKDMGFEPEWRSWADMSWAKAEAKTEHPDSPFTGLVHRCPDEDDEHGRPGRRRDGSAGRLEARNSSNPPVPNPPPLTT